MKLLLTFFLKSLPKIYKLKILDNNLLRLKTSDLQNIR